MEPKFMSEYEKQAREVAEKIGIEIVTAHQGGQCPEWAESSYDGTTKMRNACADCGTVHGDKYRVTIKRTGDRKGSISFDYWASWNDCNRTVGELRRMKVGERVRLLGSTGWSERLVNDPDYVVVHLNHKPSYYDILSCVGSDVQSSTDPDEIHDELGPMKPSRAMAIATHTRKLQNFFTEAEIALLAEVQ